MIFRDNSEWLSCKILQDNHPVSPRVNTGHNAVRRIVLLVAPRGKKMVSIPEATLSGKTEASGNNSALQYLMDQKDQTEISRCFTISERVETVFKSEEILFHFEVKQIVAFVQVLAPNDPSG